MDGIFLRARVFPMYRWGLENGLAVGFAVGALFTTIVFVVLHVIGSLR